MNISSSVSEYDTYCHRLENNDPNLKKVELDQITHEGFQQIASALKTNTIVTTLSIIDSHIDEQEANILAKILRENKNITDLEIKWSTIDSPIAGSLTEALKVSESITSIIFNGNGINFIGVKDLTKAFKENKSIKKMDFRFSQFGSEGAQDFAQVLMENETIEEMDLSGNEIGEKGWEALANALKQNNTVTKISFQKELFQEKNAKLLSEAFEINKAIRIIKLDGCEIDDRQLQIFSKAFWGNVRIQEISLVDNPIRNEGAKVLAELMKNRKIISINLDNCEVTNQGAKVLLDAMKINRFASVSLFFSAITEEMDNEFLKIYLFNQDLNKILNNTSDILLLDKNEIGGDEIKILSEALKKNKSVKKIYLKNNKIGNEGAKALAEMLKENSTLFRLELHDNEIGDEGTKHLIEALKSNKTLFEIYLDRNPISKELSNQFQGFLHFRKALYEVENKEISSVNLSNCLVDDEAIKILSEALKKNKSVKEINLIGNRIGNEGAKAIAEMLKENNALTKLYLGENEIGNEGAKALAEVLKENSNLTYISLNDNKIKDEGAIFLIEAFKTNEKTRISLKNNSCQVELSNAPDNFFRIRTTLNNKYDETKGALHLSLSRPGNMEIKFLGESLKEKKSLKEIYLNGCGIENEGAKAIAEMLKENTTLTDLYLRANEIGSEGAIHLLESLKTNKTLFGIHLDGNPISKEISCQFQNIYSFRKFLNEMKNEEISSVELHDCQINEEDIKILSEALKKNKSVKEIYLMNNKIGNKGAKALAEMLKENVTLTHIHLNDNEIGNEGTRHLIEALKTNKIPFKIYLEQNPISKELFDQFEGFLRFREALYEVENKETYSLHLSNRRINDEAIKISSEALTKALKKNTSVKEIYLRKNKIGNEGAKALAEMLKENITLEELYLEENEIGSEGAKYLFEALKTNKTLCEIHLYGNPISEEIINQFDNLFSFRKTLNNVKIGIISTVRLSNHQIDDEDIKILSKALKKNTSVKEIYLTDNKIGNEGAKALAEMLKDDRTLTELRLDKNKIGDKGASYLIEALKKNSRISRLDLDNNSCQVELSEALRNIIEIRKILNENKSNDYIFLFFPKLINETIEFLRDSLKAKKYLKEINFNGCGIGNEGVKTLAEIFEENTKGIEEIHFDRCGIGNEGLKALAEMLKKNTTITKLSLEHNKIGDEGVKYLIEALKINKTINKIRLDDNKISKSVLERLKAILKNRPNASQNKPIEKKEEQNSLEFEEVDQNKEKKILASFFRSLTITIRKEKLNQILEAHNKGEKIFSMELPKMEINDDDVEALVKVLRENETVTSLALNNNQITAKGVKVLVEALKDNKTLKSINLRGNDIKDEGIIVLAEMLLSNQTLTTINLEDNPITNKGAETLEKALQANGNIRAVYWNDQIRKEKTQSLIEKLPEDMKLTSIKAWQDSSSLEEKVKKCSEYIDKKEEWTDRAFKCAKQGNRQELETLLQRGVSLNAVHPQKKKTLLHVAVQFQQDEIIQLLLKEGASISIYDENNNQTPLDLLRKINNPNISSLFPEASISYDEAGLILAKEILEDAPVSSSLFEQLAQLEQEREEPLSEKMDTLEKQIEEYSKIHEEFQKRENALLETLELIRSQKNPSPEISKIEEELQFLKERQNLLWKDYELKKTKKEQIQKFKDQPNLCEFYLKMISLLENWIISAKAATGPFVKNEQGNVGKAAQKIELFGDLIDIVPLVGPIVDKLVKWTVGKGLNTLDEKRQKNIIQRIADFSTLTEIQKEIEKAVRFLTQCYSRQLNKLDRSKPEQKNLKGRAKKMGKSIQKKALKKVSLTDAEKIAAFASIWILATISHHQIDKKSSINVQMIETLFKKRPIGIKDPNKSMKREIISKESKEKIAKQIKKFELQKVTFIKDDTTEAFTIRDFLTMPGIQTETGELYKARWTNEAILGYCLASKELAKLRGLNPLFTETLPHKPEDHPNKLHENQESVESKKSEVFSTQD